MADGPVQTSAVDPRQQDLSAAGGAASADVQADYFTRDLASPARKAAASPPAAAGNANAGGAVPAAASKLAETAAAPPLLSAQQVQLLPEVTVNAKRDPLSQSDQHLQGLVEALPCAGCDGRQLTEPPKWVRIGESVALTALRSLLFSQPRVRGEANDEALYLAHDGVCTADQPFRCLDRPQLP